MANLKAKILRSNSNTNEEISNMDSIEKLINQVCTNFAKQIQTVMDTRFVKIEEKLNEVNNGIKNLQTKINTVEASIGDLDKRCDKIEQKLKKNSLRFYGIPGEERENTSKVITNFISQQLNISCSENDIEYAFRIGKSDSTRMQPKGIVVNFTNTLKRREVFGAKKMLKQTKFSIFEDLTTSRYRCLMAAKKRYGNDKVWSTDGNVWLWDDRQSKKTLITVVDNIQFYVK